MEEGHRYRIVAGLMDRPRRRRRCGGRLWQARLTGGSVLALLAWEYPAYYGWAAPEPKGGFADLMSQVLAEAVAGVVTGDESVPEQQKVVQARPATALLDAVGRADLLVVGNRGHGVSPRRCWVRSVSGACSTRGARWVVVREYQ